MGHPLGFAGDPSSMENLYECFACDDSIAVSIQLATSYLDARCAGINPTLFVINCATQGL